MNVFGVVFLSLIGLMFVTTVTGLSLVIRRNWLTGQQFREALAQRLSEVRLQSMLQRRGLDVTSYLHLTPANEIARAIRICAGCTRKAECDQGQPAASAEHDFKFCPNDAALSARQAS